MPKVDVETRVEPHPDVMFTALQDGEAVLLHLDRKVFFTLNATGAAMWQSIESGSTAGSVADAIHARYDVTLEDARRSVSSFIEELAQEDLVRLS
jgi:hypothetical protein